MPWIQEAIAGATSLSKNTVFRATLCSNTGCSVQLPRIMGFSSIASRPSRLPSAQTKGETMRCILATISDYPICTRYSPPKELKEDPSGMVCAIQTASGRITLSAGLKVLLRKPACEPDPHSDKPLCCSLLTAFLPRCASRRDGGSTASRWRHYSRGFRIDFHPTLYHVHVLAHLG